MVELTYLLDTDILSEPTKAKPQAHVVSRIEQDDGSIAIPAPVWHEVLQGFHRMPDSPRRRDIERYLMSSVSNIFPVLPYDKAAAEWHASERARLSRLGRTPPYADGQIAAIAAVNSLILVTGNAADYDGFEGLKIENWRK